MYTSREPFLALTDLFWLTNQFSDITDTHVDCLHLDLDLKIIWPNLMIMYVWTFIFEKIQHVSIVLYSCYSIYFKVIVEILF